MRDFDFPETAIAVRDQLRAHLADHCPPSLVRRALDGEAQPGLWRDLAGMDWAAPQLPAALGGRADPLLACLVAEELGHVLAPVPFLSTTMVAELILAAGTVAQQHRILPGLAAGRQIGAFAFAEGSGPLLPDGVMTVADGGRLTGVKMPVLDGPIADFAVVSARDGAAPGLSLFLVDLHGPNVTRQSVRTIDPTRPQACLAFADAVAEPLGAPGEGWCSVDRMLDRAAVYLAFEQLGGAERALEMARMRALTRKAFGRPIGAFQSIKHMLADMYVAVTLARSNAYRAAWALASDPAVLPAAAAIARVSATQAFQLCARQCIEVHGALGVTWDHDCHLFYRRSALLAVVLGGLTQWEGRVVAHLFDQAA